MQRQAWLHVFLLGIQMAFCAIVPDPSGYVAFCPCMGRFGNQIEQFLGVLNFAKTLNRTLLLPAFIEYPSNKMQAEMVPFEHLFEVIEIAKYHRVLPMTMFMRHLAPSLWPPESRFAFCWRPRPSVYQSNELKDGCFAKEGNPFGPFWDFYGIDFVKDVYYGNVISTGFELGYAGADAWNVQFPSSQTPVLAFTGAPAAFPISEQNRHLQRYLKWKPRIIDKAMKFIKESLTRPFVGIHLRNNRDWDNVCDNAGRVSSKTSGALFASAQCTGYNHEFGVITQDVCKPSEKTILDDVEQRVNELGAKSVFVASDYYHYISELQDHLKAYNVKVIKLDSNDAHVSLAILTHADHFIGNCISTFSAFVTRCREFGPNAANHRRVATSFFGFHDKTTHFHTEL